MAKRFFLLAALLLTAAFGGCKYPFEADLQDEYTGVVIEATVLVGGTSTISCLPIMDFNGAAEPLNFRATVEGEDGSSLSVTGRGSLRLDTHALNPSQRYRLVVETSSNRSYRSEWLEVMEAPVLDRLSYAIDGKTLQVLLSFHSDSDTPYYSIAYDEQWEYHADASSVFEYYPPDKLPDEGALPLLFPPMRSVAREYGGIYLSDNAHGPYWTCWDSSTRTIGSVVSTGALKANKLVDYPVITLPETNIKVSVRYHPMLQVWMISKDAYEYWVNLDRTSFLTGDLFTPTPSSMRGNISNPEDPSELVFGYACASRAASADLFYDNDKEHFYHPAPGLYDNLLRSALGTDENSPGVKAREMHPAYLMGFLPWEMNSDDNGNAYYLWLPSACFDCRRRGGSLTPPPLWPVVNP